MTRQSPAEPAAAPCVETYLTEIAARLPGAPRAHADIVAELRSGLLDAIDAYQSAGLSPAGAARAGIAEFGAPAEVAREFAAEIAASQARRVAVTLLISGPMVGLLWIATAVASHLSIGSGLPWQAAGMTVVLRAGILLVGIAVAVTAWAAVLGIATTGALTRWLRTRPRQASSAAAAAGFSAVAADGLGLALLATQLATAPGRLVPALAVAAAAASLARLTLAGRAARRSLAIRATLT